MKYDFSKEEVQIHKDREGRNVQVKSIHTFKCPCMPNVHCTIHCTYGTFKCYQMFLYIVQISGLIK